MASVGALLLKLVEMLHFRYAFSRQEEDETCRSLAHTSINALLPSGKQPTTLVRRLISRLIRSIPSYVFPKQHKLQRHSAPMDGLC